MRPLVKNSLIITAVAFVITVIVALVMISQNRSESKNIFIDDFQFEDNFSFLNHGSYGATPKCVTDEQESIENKISDPKFSKTDLEQIQREQYLKISFLSF